MAHYPNPIGKPNPFYTRQPVVYVVRHVRRSPAGEIIVEDPNTLPRRIYRIENWRTHPQLVAPVVPEVRNVPQSNTRKIPW